MGIFIGIALFLIFIMPIELLSLSNLGKEIDEMKVLEEQKKAEEKEEKPQEEVKEEETAEESEANEDADGYIS